MTDSIVSKLLVGGDAVGKALLLTEPLSLWGGVELSTGRIIDASHPQRGQSIAGRVVIMREARGSSSSSSALVELARRGIAPCAFVLGRPDAILAIGSLVATKLYDIAVPIAIVPVEQHQAVAGAIGNICAGEPSGTIAIMP